MFFAFVVTSHHIFITIGHLAYATNAFAFLFKNILWLRVAAIVSSSLNITYKYYGLASPAWIDIFWQSVFIAINGYRVYILVKEMLGVHFTKDEKVLYKEVFSALNPVDFFKLLRAGSQKTVPLGSVLTEENKPVNKITLIFDGEAEVVKSGHKLAKLKQYSFVGEMAFTTGELASATVTTLKPTKIYFWEFEKLQEILRRNLQLRTTFQASVGVDMAHKLGFID